MSVSWAATSYAYRGVGPPDDIIGHQDGALPLGHRHFSPTAVWQTNTDAFAIPTPRSPSPLDMFSYNNNIRSGREAAYGRSFRPQSALANLPNEIFSRIFVLCDDVSLLDAALVCRRWLVLSRRAFMTSYTIESANDFNRLLLLLQSTNTFRSDYISHMDIAFTSDETVAGSSAMSNRTSRRQHPHVPSSDVYRLLSSIPVLDSLRLDWVGTRNTSLANPLAGPMPSVPIPLPPFLLLPHILHRLCSIEIRGGSWPLDSLLPALASMTRLRSLTLDNIYEPNTDGAGGSPAMGSGRGKSSGMYRSPIPSMSPSFQLTKLSLARCTLSGDVLAWILSTSMLSLRHLTMNTIRRRVSGITFGRVLAGVGPALETFRIRNHVDLFERWDLEGLVQAGLGYCSNLRTFVVWCDPPQAGSMAIGGAQPFSPQPSPGVYRGYGGGGGGSGIGSPVSPGSSSSSLAMLGGYAPAPAPGTLLPLLVSVVQRGWMPRLTTLVVQPSHIDQCPSRVECTQHLLLRGVRLYDEWVSV
ncbi:SubName: Full=Uncharacterized protein {ECO:0000313/EMBL:CCA72842.1} [Serendipita indica DSM 11827]|nr:SubName: Full=Uncharacterized protein {ECO:0000313/EMBL:CCA72842.1} [Serendipita indica DSM 11827]